jgi:hypothetical protein
MTLGRFAAAWRRFWHGEWFARLLRMCASPRRFKPSVRREVEQQHARLTRLLAHIDRAHAGAVAIGDRGLVRQLGRVREQGQRMLEAAR